MKKLLCLFTILTPSLAFAQAGTLPNPNVSQSLVFPTGAANNTTLGNALKLIKQCYDIKADGITDDTTALLACRAAAPSGSMIRLPTGDMKLTAFPSTPGFVLWKLDGTTFNGGNPIQGIGTDLLESTINDGKWLTKASTRPDSGPSLRLDTTYNHTGGTVGDVLTTLNTNCNLTSTGADLNNYVWCNQTVATSSATGPGQHVALSGTMFRPANALADGRGIRSPTWAGYFENQDLTGGFGGNQVGIENDLYGNGNDINSNNRIILQMEIAKSQAGGATYRVGSGIVIGVNDGTSYYGSMIGLVAPFDKAGLDLSNATSMGNAPAIKLATNQRIDFSGNGNQELLYNSGGYLQYLYNNTEIMHLDNNGSMQLSGGVTVNNTTASSGVNVQGNSPIGVNLTGGTFSSAAIRLADGQVIAREGTNVVVDGWHSGLYSMKYGANTMFSSDAVGNFVIGGNLDAKVQPTGLTTARKLADRANDRLSILDFGAKCDATYQTNITDDSNAITAAMASGKVISIPSNTICYGASISQAFITTTFVGPGQIKTSDGNLHGPIVSQMSAAPSRVGAANIVQGFNGDYSHSPFVIERRVTGTATLGQPTTGYVFTNEAAANYTFFYNESGWNNSTGTASAGAGRTGVGSSVVNLFHNGQGDAMANFASVFVNGPNKTGATSFLANPAAAILAGQVVAGHAGVYLQGLGDIDLSDNGFDVAAMGTTINLTRTVASSSLGTTWIGHRVQSNSTVPPDAAFSLAGSYKVGIDLADAAGTQASIAMQAGQRIYLNTTQPDPSGVNFPSTLLLGTEYIDYSAANGFELVTAYGSLNFGTINNRFSVGPGEVNTSVLGTALGGYNTVSGGYAVALGGANTAGGRASVVMGLQASDHGNDGAKCAASGDIATLGDAQECSYVLRAVTTTTAGKVLTTDGNAPSSGPFNCIQIPANSTFALRIRVIARDFTTPGAYSHWVVNQAVMSRDTSTTYQGNAPTQISLGNGSSASLTVGADSTKGCLAVTFTSPNTDTWHVVASVNTTEVQ